MAPKTDLQREILVTAYNNPRLNQSQIASRVGCSSSYVSNILNRFNSIDAMQAEIEQMNFDLGYDPYADIDTSLNIAENPDWFQGENLDTDLDQVVKDGVEGLKVLTKKTKGLITKFRD